jgi:immune inhibitor A
MRVRLTLLLLLISVMANAIPAKRDIRSVVQSDGTQLQVMLVGDEWFHYYQTVDGVPLMQRGNDYYYADVSGFALTASDVLAHNLGSRSAAEQHYVATIQDVNNVMDNVCMNRTVAMRLPDSNDVTFTGHHKGLIILAQFADCQFSMADPQKEYDAIANKVGYNEHGALGSVHDYFVDQSDGLFDLDFDVVGPVNLANNYAYYGGNNASGSDSCPARMIVEACKAVDSVVNFKDYDWNGDGKVDQVFVLYAGYGEATGGDANTIWPHEYTLKEALGDSLSLDSMTINTYACSNELNGYKEDTPKKLMGLGMFCHEFSHCLGLPDMYDRKHINFGMNAWDLLDFGSYNGPTTNDGWCPAGFTSYEKAFAGWLKPIELKESNTTVSNMKPLSDNGDAYIIYNDNHNAEYYLVENRQKTGWDSYLPGAGMLILHVDYEAYVWGYNIVNTSYWSGWNNHQRLTMFHADNSATTYTTPDKAVNVAYPYLGNDSLTDNSTPAAKLYKANTDGTRFMHKPVTSIKQNADATMSFYFSNNNQQSGIKLNDFLTDNNHVSVFTVDGNRVNYYDYESLKPGIYIIKKNDGESVKMIKK